MTAIDAIRIIEVEIVDLRVPTSDTLLGSDPFHKNPNYSAVLTTLKTDAGTKGISVCFTAGAGNDWIAYGAYPTGSVWRDRVESGGVLSLPER